MENINLCCGKINIMSVFLLQLLKRDIKEKVTGIIYGASFIFINHA
jgi:hypothetical protein